MRTRFSQTLGTRAAAALAADTTIAKNSSDQTPSATDYELQVVNSVWGQAGLPWASPFLDILAKSYGTGVYTADFEKDANGALSTINDWVSTETGGRIDPLLPPGTLDSSTRMVIVNAVHLKTAAPRRSDPAAGRKSRCRKPAWP